MIELLPLWEGEFPNWIVLCEHCPSRYMERANCTAYYDEAPHTNTAQLAEHWREEAERFDRARNTTDARHAWACYRELLRQRIAELQHTNDPEDERLAAQLRDQLAYLMAESH